MASNDTDAFVVDMAEARQHDELVVEHFSEANTGNEDICFHAVSLKNIIGATTLWSGRPI